MRVSSTKNLGSQAVLILFFGYFFTRIFLSEPWPVRQRTEEVNIIRKLSAPVCLAGGQQSKAVIVKTSVARQEKAGESWHGVASWYGVPFHGRKMANGKIFDMHDPTTVAHRSLPFGTKLRVTNLKNNKELVVTVRDRGPYTKDKRKKFFTRDLDLSYAAADLLGATNDGVINVKVEQLR